MRTSVEHGLVGPKPHMIGFSALAWYLFQSPGQQPKVRWDPPHVLPGGPSQRWVLSPGQRLGLSNLWPARPGPLEVATSVACLLILIL